MGQFPIWGLMPQHSEVTRLVFDQAQGTSETAADNVFIDLAACMTVVNRKQFHHTARDGSPLCYAFTLSVGEDDGGGPVMLETLPSNWTMRNAIKMTAAAWKAQLKHGGIKLSSLPAYGRRLRLGWSRDSLNATGAPVDEESHLARQLYPCNAQGVGITGAYTASDGTIVTFEQSNEVTQIVGEDELIMRVIAAAGTSDAAGILTFGVWGEYLDYRRSSPDVDLSMDATEESIMATLFATSEELSDDILEAVKDDLNYKPYNEVQYTFEGAKVLPAIQVNSSHGVAPCGLLRINIASGDVGDRFYIDVHAIYEM